MKLIDETDLRVARIPAGTKEYRLPEGGQLTPLAKEYLASRGITAVCGEPHANSGATPGKKYKRYVDAATGLILYEKPESMTHIRDNILVPKSHPRIVLRGKLDSLESKILEAQIAAKKSDKTALYNDLQEALCYVRAVLAAEVKDVAFASDKLFGLDGDELRSSSHDVAGGFGFDAHPVPDAKMGELAVLLNLLRTQTRECELAAVAAFGSGRVDIVRALNRLSSGFYILFCREVAGRYR